MKALAARWAGVRRAAKIFRPYRDVRFAKDKTPYKTHQGAYVAVGAVDRVVRPGLRRAACAPAPASTRRASPRLAAFRDAIADDRTGPELARILASSRRTGWEVGGDRLKTTPRGYDADHPRIELLRHKSMTVGHELGFEPMIHTPELLDLVRKDWRALRPLVEWVAGAPTDRGAQAASVKLAIVRSGSQNAFIEATRPSSSTT